VNSPGWIDGTHPYVRLLPPCSARCLSCSARCLSSPFWQTHALGEPCGQVSLGTFAPLARPSRIPSSAALATNRRPRGTSPERREKIMSSARDPNTSYLRELMIRYRGARRRTTPGLHVVAFARKIPHDNIRKRPQSNCPSLSYACKSSRHRSAYTQCPAWTSLSQFFRRHPAQDLERKHHRSYKPPH
jgi:hypothetical protein